MLIGDRSYGWYLWHWPLLVLGVTLGIPAGSAGSLLLSALSLLIAAGSYRWIELPFWKGRISRASAPRTLVAGIVVMMAAVTLVLRYSNSVTNSDEAKAERKLLAARTDLPPIYRYGCDTWYHSAEVSPCIIDTHHAKQTVVVLGDSIGLQWFSLWPTVFDPKSWRIVVLTKSSCPLVDEDFFYERIGKIYDVCNQWRDAVLTALPRLAPDVVIVGNAATYKFTPNQWAYGTIRVLAKIAAAAVDVLLIPGTPPLQVDGPGCLARQLKAERAGLHAAESCTNNDISPQTTDVSDFLKQAADRFANVQILNLNDLVCPDGHCGAQTADGLIVYRDQQHLTDSFVRSQTEAVRSRLRALGLGHYLTDGTVTRPERRPLASDHRRPSAR